MSIQESDQILLVFPYQCPNQFVLCHKYAMKGFNKEFALQGSFVAILWLNEVNGTCKTNILTALKSRSCNFGLDHVKLSLKIFFVLLSGSSFIFVKNTPKKAANIALQPILAAKLGYIESLEVLFRHQVGIFLSRQDRHASTLAEAQFPPLYGWHGVSNRRMHRGQWWYSREVQQE